MIAVFEINHELRGENQVNFGIGNPTSPLDLKLFGVTSANGGDHQHILQTR